MPRETIITGSAPQLSLFEEKPAYIEITRAAVLLPGYALDMDSDILTEVAQIISLAPLRQMKTPGGYQMSVQMTNCGEYGWISDLNGYRYSKIDPISGKKWPQMPKIFEDLAQKAALEAGFQNFCPDACLINQYIAGNKLSLHQDRDEKDLAAPIVSLSLGIDATFIFGGIKRSDRLIKVELVHGDVIVWGGQARLAYHGIQTIKESSHPLLGPRRINLTFRKSR